MRLSLDVSAVPDRPAGAGRYALELARGLSRIYGDRLHLISRKNDRTRWNDIAPAAEVHALVPEQRPLRLAWEQVAMPRHLTRLGVDVHHGPHYTLPERARVAKVATIHDMFFFDNPEWHEGAKIRLFRRAIRTATQRANELIAVSAYTEERLRTRFGDVPVTAIPLGVDHERFNTSGEVDDVAALSTMGIGGRFIAFVGTIEPRKNVPGLLRAFDAIAARHRDISLVLAGRAGWKSEEFDATLSAMVHRDRVLRPGYVSDAEVRALLRCADVVAFPSFAEGFGLPALEAMACGAVLVTSSGTAMAEVTGDAAILVDARSDIELADGLERALSGGQEVALMRSKGPVIAKDFTWDRTVDAHVRVLERVAAAARR